jgi:hypothetical protein
MRRRAKQLKLEPLEAILLKILRKQNIPHTRRDQRLIDLWAQAVGSRIAARTFPDTLRRGTLRVRVASPVWLHQLQFMKEEILLKLQELAGNDAIGALSFSIGELPPPPMNRPAPAPATPPAALKGRDRRMVDESLAVLKDPELRAIMERVMVREISRRREMEKRKAP